MAVTKEEALAFVEVLSSGKPAVHLEAVLGLGNVPSVKDFEVDTEPAIERCQEFLALMEDYGAALGGLVQRSGERRTKRLEAEKKNSLPLPGLEPAGEGADAEAPAKKRKAAKA